MKCPKCHVDLAPATRHRIEVQTCPSCEGMWFDPGQLKSLENEVFALDEHAKGTLVFSAATTACQCPACAAPLKRFNYRLYDLEMEYCDQGHGYWLDKGEDTRVLQLMKAEEKGIDRSMDAETQWGSLVKHLHSGRFLDKVRDLFR